MGVGVAVGVAVGMAVGVAVGVGAGVGVGVGVGVGMWVPTQSGRRRRHPPWTPPRVTGAACEGQTHHCLNKCASIARVDRLT